MPFKKGTSGNPAGRKRGTSQAAKLLQAIEHDLPEIINAIVDAAKQGDTSAAKLLLDRVIPALKPQQQTVEISGLSDKSLSEQGQAIINAMGDGNLTPEQAQNMLAGIASLSKINEIDELERRLTDLEKRRND